MKLWKEVQLAEVEFSHAWGCTLGSPYGECVRTCGYKVIRLDRKEIRPATADTSKLTLEEICEVMLSLAPSYSVSTGKLLGDVESAINLRASKDDVRNAYWTLLARSKLIRTPQGVHLA